MNRHTLNRIVVTTLVAAIAVVTFALSARSGEFEESQFAFYRQHSASTAKATSAMRKVSRRAPQARVALVPVKSSRTAARMELSATVASAAQALVNEVEALGFPIKYMGGWRRHGSVRASLHPAGLAFDLCQWARNRTDGRKGCALPNNAALNAIAARHGLFHGALWCNADRGHFQLGGYQGSTCTAHHHRQHRTRFARAM